MKNGDTRTKRCIISNTNKGNRVSNKTGNKLPMDSMKSFSWIQRNKFSRTGQYWTEYLLRIGRREVQGLNSFFQLFCFVHKQINNISSLGGLQKMTGGGKICQTFASFESKERFKGETNNIIYDILYSL